MYNLKEILSATDYICNQKISPDLTVSEIISDSKRVTPGCLFICLKGLRHNSHDFIGEVIKRGALAVICDNNCSYVSKNAFIIHVNNPHSAYSKILSNAYKIKEKGLKIIAVTGTNGKTTVTHMIHSALTALGKRTALIGTLGGFFENEQHSVGTMTTPNPELLYPLLARFADLGAEYAVMELSSHALALCKADGLFFEVGAITNITPEHLDFHGNMECYTKEKSKLFTLCKTGVFCIDDEYTSKIYSEATCESKLSCSISNPNADIFAENISLMGTKGSSFDASYKNKKTNILSSLPGSFTVSNALLAFSVLSSLGFEPNEVSKGIASLKNVRGRMEVLPINADFSVIIDFAHTPDAISKLLQSVHSMRRHGERIVTLFGCGGDRDASKRSLMGAIASQLSDFVIITSDNSRSESVSKIIKQIMSGFDNKCPHICIDDRREAIEYAIKNAMKGDIILLCGKGHEEYEIDSNGIHHFSERETVFNALMKFMPRYSEKALW